MRVSAIPILVAGAGLVGASPLNVMIASTEMSALRLGHPAAAGISDANAVNGGAAVDPSAPGRMRHMCKGMQKTVSDGVIRIFSVFGLGRMTPPPVTMPIIQPSSDEADEAHGHKGVIVKFGGFATPSHAAVDINGASTDEETPVRTQPMVIHHHNMHMHGFNPRAPFWARVHRSLMLLGPWEGRAVAFVLGCGIGVLLRMVWVLTVLTFRTIRGTSREEPEIIYHEIVFEDAEDILVAPPQYTDEKVALAAAEDNNKPAEGEQPRV